MPPSDERGRLPNTFSLSGSADGVHFEKLRPAVERTAVAWTAGNRAWVKGYGGHLECRFPPVDLKTLRLQIPGGRRDDTNTWRIAEIYLFEESSPSAMPEEEPSKVWAKARELGLDFVAADRWLSARLAERRRSDADTPKVYPRYNPKYPATLLDRRLAPRAGLGLAVAKGVADETESLLRATFPHAEWTRHDFDAYALLAFRRAAARSPDEGPVQWSGSFLLKATASGEGPAETK